MKDAKTQSLFGHMGPRCSSTNSKFLRPFIGPKLTGYIPDHILVSDNVEVLIHGSDPARANGEFPSDHLPVVADLLYKD